MKDLTNVRNVVKDFLICRLVEHYNVHTGEKPFKCKYCQVGFGSNGTKAMHEKGHLGIK